MKNDRRTYRRPREPVNKRRFAWKPSEGRSDFLSNLRKVTEKPTTGFLESDVGELAEIECDVGLTVNTLLSAESGMTWLTGKEIHHGCGLTFKQVLLRCKKPLAFGKHECPDKNSTQQSMQGRNISRSSMIMIQMARSKLSESDRSEFGNVNRLWLEVGRLYSSFLEYNSTAAINSAGPESSRRIGNWHSEFYRDPVLLPLLRSWQSVLPMSQSAGCMAEGNSVMVESVRLVLQRWRGVCSFSQTMRSTWSDEESRLVYDLRSKNNVGLPARLRFGGENDMLRSYSKALKYDDISVT